MVKIKVTDAGIDKKRLSLSEKQKVLQKHFDAYKLKNPVKYAQKLKNGEFERQLKALEESTN